VTRRKEDTEKEDTEEEDTEEEEEGSGEGELAIATA
jgi:hypothetical protein